jgi:hypothetical protein
MSSRLNEPVRTIAAKNVITVLRALFMRYRSAVWQVPAYIVLKLSGPFLSTLIPTVALHTYQRAGCYTLSLLWQEYYC